MQLSNLFLAFTAALTASVSAAPSTAVPAAIPHCDGDLQWDITLKVCKCKSGNVYNLGFTPQCIKDPKVQSIEHKQCRKGEKLYCARGEGEYVEYNVENPICRDTHHSKVFCARKSKVSEVFRAEIRREWEYETFSAAEKEFERREQERKSCARPRVYNYDTKVCECPGKQIWTGRFCVYQVIPEPVCGRHQRAFCARGEVEIVVYGKEHNLCRDDGINYTFCGGLRREKKQRQGQVKEVASVREYEVHGQAHENKKGHGQSHEEAERQVHVEPEKKDHAHGRQEGKQVGVSGVCDFHEEEE